MIELLINKRTRLPIVAKPAGSPWGYRELDGPNLCVVALDDPPAQLVARLDRTSTSSVESHRVAANPFAEYAIEEITKRPVMVRQSTIELRAADVRCGARVRIEDCRLQIVD